jgi:Protein of unknown function (DUF2934)
MNRKTKPENDTAVPSDAAPSRPRRQAAASRVRRASAPEATSVPPAADVDAVVTPESTSSVAQPKLRRKASAPRTIRRQTKAEAPVELSADREAGEIPATAGPSRQAIAELAYLYWQARAGREGSADDDWLRAERALRQRVSDSC